MELISHDIIITIIRLIYSYKHISQILTFVVHFVDMPMYGNFEHIFFLYVCD